ncbi:helix-turn-helix domain-containing protein [Actinoallomurus iriomotensis]|uniref:helix-turn-helix domain-containing protein n=1 Tax=Actinoallomurus iriomotensis TaxID=478107 RepID=UPI002557AE12|nr:LysR family transcriptional regulator [Actinoallomurus iriomotensis]
MLDALLEGSVTGAAERLQPSSPAISRALGRLRTAVESASGSGLDRISWRCIFTRTRPRQTPFAGKALIINVLPVPINRNRPLQVIDCQDN